MFLFASQFLKDMRHTGSLWPSSRALAKAMTLPLRRRARGTRRVLEVGPGTGPVTRSILECLRSGDELHIVELNREFCEHLDERLLQPFCVEHPDVAVHLHCTAIQTAPLAGRFDLIVCSLPFNNFPPTLVRAIFKQMIRLLAPDGELTYFEYFGVRTIKTPFVGPASRRKLKQISATGRILRRRHAGERRLVLANFPPAFSMRLKG